MLTMHFYTHLNAWQVQTWHPVLIIHPWTAHLHFLFTYDFFSLLFLYMEVYPELCSPSQESAYCKLGWTGSPGNNKRNKFCMNGQSENKIKLSAPLKSIIYDSENCKSNELIGITRWSWDDYVHLSFSWLCLSSLVMYSWLKDQSLPTLDCWSLY